MQYLLNFICNWEKIAVFLWKFWGLYLCWLSQESVLISLVHRSSPWVGTGLSDLKHWAQRADVWYKKNYFFIRGRLDWIKLNLKLNAIIMYSAVDSIIQTSKFYQIKTYTTFWYDCYKWWPLIMPYGVIEFVQHWFRELMNLLNQCWLGHHCNVEAFIRGQFAVCGQDMGHSACNNAAPSAKYTCFCGLMQKD